MVGKLFREVNNMHGYRPRQIPIHKPCQVTARMNFSKSHLDEGKDFWDLVLWNDPEKNGGYWTK